MRESSTPGALRSFAMTTTDSKAPEARCSFARSRVVLGSPQWTITATALRRRGRVSLLSTLEIARDEEEKKDGEAVRYRRDEGDKCQIPGHHSQAEYADGCEEARQA